MSNEQEILIDILSQLSPGQAFRYNQRTWLVAPDAGMPAVLQGYQGDFRVLLRNGTWERKHPESSVVNRPECWTWTLSWGNPVHIVAYWYEDMDKDCAAAAAPSRQTARFQKEGFTWTPCDGLSMPEDLLGIAPKDWMTIDSGGLISTRDSRPSWSQYWGEKSRWKIRAYCIISRDKLPEESASTRKTFEALGKTWFDCSEDRTCPAELKNTEGADWEYISTKVKSYVVAVGGADEGVYVREWKMGHFKAFRLIESAPIKAPAVKRAVRKFAAPAEPVQDPNADMISRDGKGPLVGDELIKSMVGNGNIFGAPKREPIHPLFRVASIPKTGSSLWGAEHLKE